MADTAHVSEEVVRKPSKLPTIIALILACVGGGAGFYATWSNMILTADSVSEKEEKSSREASATSIDIAYVEVAPITVSLRAPSTAQYLRFRTNLEVPTGEVDAVKKLLPRVTDVLNNYLRALEPADLEDPSALARLRAQMLRRVQVIVGQKKINDLLIMEFVLN